MFDAGNPPSFCTPASLANILKFDVPIADVLAFPPAPIVAPLALEAADSSFTGIDFAPHSFVGGPVQRGAALYSLEGDFGFSPPNATDPAPEVGHEVKLMNFNQDPSAPLSISFQNFARNDTGDEAFISPGHTAGFNRPTNLRFGPDGCAYVVDYGAVRDPGGGPGGLTRFVNPADAPLVQFPGTGVTSMPAPVASGWSDLAGWALHPLESAAFSRRTPKPDYLSRDHVNEWPAAAGCSFIWRLPPMREGCRGASRLFPGRLLPQIRDNATLPISAPRWSPDCRRGEGRPGVYSRGVAPAGCVDFVHDPIKDGSASQAAGAFSPIAARLRLKKLRRTMLATSATGARRHERLWATGNLRANAQSIYRTMAEDQPR